jgi:hypothetical protein
MSKLSEYQIRALIPGMEATLQKYAPGTRQRRTAEERLAAYQAELLSKTAQLEQPQDTQVECFHHTHSQKLLNSEQSIEVMEQKKNALMIAGEHVEREPEALLELGKWVGRGQAFGMMGARASAAQAQVLKRIKDGAEYKTLGQTWEQFCEGHIGVSRATVDRIISNFEEFGAAYFNLANVMRISPTTYRVIAGAIDESTIELDGEKIAITKANSARIAEAVAALRKTVDQKDERLAEHKRDADKLRAERNAASKAAEKARQELVELKKAQSARWANADEDQSTLLDAQSHFDLAMAKLAAVYKHDLSEENQSRYIGLTEYMYRALIQATFDARDKYGVGWNMAEPADLLAVEQVAPTPRNLVTEFTEKARK